MNVRFAAQLISFAPLALAAGCFVDLGEMQPVQHAAAATGDLCPCQDNSECQRGEYCLRGFCRDIPPGAEQCRTSMDCRRREACINGFCTEICAKHGDCSSGDCEENYCCMAKPTDGGTPKDGGTGPKDGGASPKDGGTGPCGQHSDCGAGAYCINGVCYLACHSDADCPSTEACQSGACRLKPGSTQPPCTSGAQCLMGEDCVDGRCRAKCSPSSPCPSGYSCVIGYCTPIPSTGSGTPCSASCECPTGETCQNGACRL